MATFLFLSTLFFTLLTASMADPTDGFTDLPISSSNIQVQKPYNVSVDQGCSNSGGYYKCWVNLTDTPYSSTNTTKPRAEVRIIGCDYTSGVWQFEGKAYVPSGTTGVCIMQIFGGSTQATAAMLRVYNGNLAYYTTNIVSNIYNRWFRVNIIHDVGARRVTVYIDGVQKYQASDNGAATHYFKFGVYTQDNPSNYLESRWTGIRVLRKN